MSIAQRGLVGRRELIGSEGCARRVALAVRGNVQGYYGKFS
jgi:hypothetical protein